jgi:hypothetical protein
MLTTARRLEIEAPSAIEQLSCPDEIEAVLFDVGLPLPLVPFKAHGIF